MSYFDNLDDSFSPTTNKYEFDYNTKDDDDDDSDDDLLLLHGGPAFKKKTKTKQTQQTRKDNKMLDNLNQFMLQEEERFVAKKTILDMDESREREKKEEENNIVETAGEDDDIILQNKKKENHYESEEGEGNNRRVPVLTTKKRKEINVDSNSNNNNKKLLKKKQSNEDDYWKEIHNIVNRCSNNEQRAKRRQKLQDAADGIEFNSQDYDDDELLETSDSNNPTMNSVTTTSYQSDLLSSMKSIMKVDDMMDMDVSAWNSKRRKDMASANLTGLSVNLGCRKIFFIPSNSNTVKSPSLANNNNYDEKKIASTSSSSDNRTTSSNARAARAIARRRTAKAIDDEKKNEASLSLSPEERRMSYNFDSKQNAIKTLTNIITDLSSSSSSSSPSLTVINQTLLTPMKKAIQCNHLSFYLANLSFQRIISQTPSLSSFGEIPMEIIIWLWKVACSSFPDDCILSEGAYRLVHEWISSFHDNNNDDEDGSLLVPDEKHEFFLLENIMNGFKFATGYNDTLIKSNDDDDVIQKRMSSSNSMVELQQPPQCKNNNAIVSNNAIRDRSNDIHMMPLDPFVMKHFLLLFNASLKTNKLIHTTTTTTPKEQQNATTTADDIVVRSDDHHLNLAKEYLQIFLFSSLDPCFYQGNG